MAQQRERETEALIPGPPVAGHYIQHNAHARIFLIDQQMIRLRPIGYQVLFCLLERADHCVPYGQLLACIDDRPAAMWTARERLSYHVSRVRPHVWVCGMDIGAVMGVGYILLSTREEVSPDKAGDEE
jgi:DNA-binding response OmpR family regulator